ncbi:MAG: hypothetical protein ACD_2C00225G0001, partial [uncultured bacterium (gcode 4)]
MTYFIFGCVEWRGESNQRGSFIITISHKWGCFWWRYTLRWTRRTF